MQPVLKMEPIFAEAICRDSTVSRFQLKERIAEFGRLLLHSPNVATCPAAEVPVREVPKGEHALSVGDLAIEENFDASQDENDLLCVSAALDAISSCRSADTLDAMVNPLSAGSRNAPVASLSELACAVLCGQCTSRLVLLDRFVDVIIERCILSAVGGTSLYLSSLSKESGTEWDQRRAYALSLLRHLSSNVAPMLFPTSAQDSVARMFPACWHRPPSVVASAENMCAAVGKRFSQRRHAVRCVATRCLESLGQHISRRIKTEVNNAAAAAGADEARRRQLSKQNGTSNKRSAVVSLLRGGQGRVVVQYPSTVSLLVNLTEQLQTLQRNVVNACGYTNTTVFSRDVEWLLVGCITCDAHVSTVRSIRSAWRERIVPTALIVRGNVAPPLKASTASLNTLRPTTESSLPAAPSATPSAAVLALDVLLHLETHVDRTGVFAHPFWRLDEARRGGRLAGSSVSDGGDDVLQRFECTMLMRKVLEGASSASAGEQHGGTLSSLQGCYAYMCAALEAIVDDSVTLFGPHHPNSTLAESMRKELTKRAIVCGLLQR